VDAEGKCSHDVRLNALFRHFDGAVAPRIAPTSRVHSSLYEAAHLHPCIALDGRVPLMVESDRRGLWVGMLCAGSRRPGSGGRNITLVRATGG
jgi:hypothetical protein